MAMRASVLAAALLAAAGGAAGVVYEMNGTSRAGWLEIGRFCFDVGDPGGMVDVRLSADRARSDDLEVLLFDDEPGSWPAALGLPCAEAARLAKNVDPRTRRVPALYRPWWDGQGRWLMPPTPVREEAHPRFWYVVVANCRGFEDLGYEVAFLNPGGLLRRPFGVDQQGLLQLHAACALLYALLALRAWTLRDGAAGRSPLWRPTMFIAACGAAGSAYLARGFGVALLRSTTGAFMAENALASQWLGTVLQAAAASCFVALALGVAGGYGTRSRAAADADSSLWAGAAAAGAAAVLAPLSGVNLPFYGRVPPIGESAAYDAAAAAGLAAAAWFQVLVTRTARAEAGHRLRARFYRYVRVVFGGCLLAQPLALVACRAVLPAWHRAFAVAAAVQVSTLFSLACLVHSMRPGGAGGKRPGGAPLLAEVAAFEDDDGL